MKSATVRSCTLGNLPLQRTVAEPRYGLRKARSVCRGQRADYSAHHYTTPRQNGRRSGSKQASSRELDRTGDSKTEIEQTREKLVREQVSAPVWLRAGGTFPRPDTISVFVYRRVGSRSFAGIAATKATPTPRFHECAWRSGSLILSSTRRRPALLCEPSAWHGTVFR